MIERIIKLMLTLAVAVCLIGLLLTYLLLATTATMMIIALLKSRGKGQG